jgi:hypothetical protein
MRIFGKSVKTVTMSQILPIFTLVLTISIGLFPATNIALSVDDLPKTGGSSLNSRQPATVSNNKPAQTRSNPISQKIAYAQAILKRAIEQLESRHSIAADLGCRVDILGQKLTGRGVYREVRSGPIPLVRTEMTFPMQPQPGVIAQVCDGDYLWTYRNLAQVESLERVDLIEVERALNESGSDTTDGPSDYLSSIGGGYGPAGILGAGGLSRLLREIDGAFACQFIEETELAGNPVWRLEGKWRAAPLAKILGTSAKKICQLTHEKYLERRPDHLPDQVVLLLGKQDFFPYRIEYRQIADPETNKGKTIVAIQLMRVKFDGPINEACFDYQPGELEFEDKTGLFLETLRNSVKIK